MNFQDKIKTALSEIDLEQFNTKDCIIGGDECMLVTSRDLGFKWSQKTKYLRSVIFRKSDFYPVSLSFPKFVNFGENPENFPVPNDLNDAKILTKIDGSLITCTKYKGEYVIRTRGTSDCSELINKEDLELFKDKILKQFDFLSEKVTWNASYIFEYVTPHNKIVIDYGETDFYLIGIINHSDYSLWSQKKVDTASKILNAKRPQYFNFNSISDLITNVKLWKDKEGVVLYSNNDQDLHKIKGDWYLSLHSLKAELGNIEKVIDLYITLKYPDYLQFKEYIEKTFDFEIWKTIQGQISRICDAMKDVQNIIFGFQNFIDKRNDWDRKKLALDVLASYGNTNRASFVFELKDKNKLSDNSIKKLLFQTLKK